MNKISTLIKKEIMHHGKTYIKKNDIKTAVLFYRRYQNNDQLLKKEKPEIWNSFLQFIRKKYSEEVVLPMKIGGIDSEGSLLDYHH